MSGDDLLLTFLQRVLAGRTTGMAVTLGEMAAQVTGGMCPMPFVEALAAECQLALNQLMLDGVARICVPLADAGQIHIGLAATPEALVIECRPVPHPATPMPVARWQEHFPTPITARRQTVRPSVGGLAGWEAAC